MAPLGKKGDKVTLIVRKSQSIGIVVNVGKSWQKETENEFQIENIQFCSMSFWTIE